MDRNKRLEIEYGKIPPQNLDAEKSILASCLTYKDSFLIANEILTMDMFYASTNQIIWGAMSELKESNKNIDIISLGQILDDNDVLEQIGGNYFLMKLTDDFISSDVKQSCEIIKEAYVRRLYIERGHNLIKGAYASFDEAEEGFKELSSSIINALDIKIDNSLASLMKVVDDNRKNPIVGLSTYLDSLDNKFTWEKGTLNYLAALPSVGKTSLAMFFVSNLLKDKKNVIVSSFEMPDAKVLSWIMMSNGIPYRNIKHNVFHDGEKKEYNRVKRMVLKQKLRFSSKKNRHIDKYCNEIRLLHSKERADFIIIDYLQLMTGDGGDTNTILERLTSKLQELAIDINVPILALSQLNRSVHQNAGKRPNMSSLRSSGSIEQSGDTIMFIHRDKLGEAEFTIDGISVSSEGIAELIIEKNRDGNIGSVFIKHSEDLKSFSDYKAEPHSAATVFEDYAPNDGMLPNVAFESGARDDFDEQAPF